MTPKGRKNHRVFCKSALTAVVKEFGQVWVPRSPAFLVAGLGVRRMVSEGSVREKWTATTQNATDFAGVEVGAALCATDATQGVTSLAAGVTFGEGTANLRKSEIRSSKRQILEAGCCCCSAAHASNSRSDQTIR